ncbi:Isochorismatase-like protein [Paraphoma chrysanthemicola]|nr:Isochorismatase-like protein [Paraphoma chrysanthemicola]
MSSSQESKSSRPNKAIVLVDVYNEFLHPSGKIYPIVSESLTETNTVSHLTELVDAARRARLPIYYALHQTWKEGNYDGWQHMNTTTSGIAGTRAIEEGSWGAEIFQGLEPDILGNRDVVVSKHWNSSGFANTDLDYQLHQREITHLVLAGMIANTCLESTARYARELGYHVTLFDHPGEADSASDSAISDDSISIESVSDDLAAIKTKQRYFQNQIIELQETTRYLQHSLTSSSYLPTFTETWASVVVYPSWGPFLIVEG